MAHTQTILIIDDDHDIRSMLREALEDSGYRVLSAGHGASALGLIDQGEVPSCILLDLNMPVMNGDEFLAEADKRPSLRDIPIIQISAGRGPKRPRACCAFSKPFDLNELLAALRDGCGVA